MEHIYKNLGRRENPKGCRLWEGCAAKVVRGERQRSVKEKSYVIDWLCKTCEKIFCPMLYLAMHFWREKRWLG